MAKERKKESSKKRKNHSVDQKRKSKKKRRRNSHDSKQTLDHVQNYEVGLLHAVQIVKEMLKAAPEISTDLLNIFNMLDKGESVIIENLEDQVMKEKLAHLFTLLSLRKKGEKYRKCRHEYLLDTFQSLLDQKHVVPLKRGPIGPTLPSQPDEDDDDDADDDIIGPALPGTKGFRYASATTAEVEARCRDEIAEQWEIVKDRSIHSSDNKPKREEWMTAMPETKSLSGILGASGDVKHRHFTNKEKVEQDLSWFENPEERQRKEREKADIELFGYSRNASKARTTIGSSVPERPAVNESIMPVANPEVDERLSESMEKMRKLRGKTLVERQREKHGKAGATNDPSVWNRERDLVASQQMSHKKVVDIMKNASNMADRFAAPQMTRQFL